MTVRETRCPLGELTGDYRSRALMLSREVPSTQHMQNFGLPEGRQVFGENRGVCTGTVLSLRGSFTLVREPVLGTPAKCQP